MKALLFFSGLLTLVCRGSDEPSRYRPLTFKNCDQIWSVMRIDPRELTKILEFSARESGALSALADLVKDFEAKESAALVLKAAAAGLPPSVRAAALADWERAEISLFAGEKALNKERHAQARLYLAWRNIVLRWNSVAPADERIDLENFHLASVSGPLMRKLVLAGRDVLGPRYLAYHPVKLNPKERDSLTRRNLPPAPEGFGDLQTGAVGALKQFLDRAGQDITKPDRLQKLFILLSYRFPDSGQKEAAAFLDSFGGLSAREGELLMAQKAEPSRRVYGGLCKYAEIANRDLDPQPPFDKAKLGTYAEAHRLLKVLLQGVPGESLSIF
ncbi:hypothetical protein K2X33_12720 [bacterium]|nr:hypothetical protein [bacterium]